MPKKASSSTPESEKEVKTTKKAATPKTAGETVKKKAVRKKAVASDGTAPVKKPRKKSAKTAAGEAASQVVLKAYWGVFNPQMVQIAQYDYFQQDDAQKAADDLTEKKKLPHFIQLIKKIV